MKYCLGLHYFKNCENSLMYTVWINLMKRYFIKILNEGYTYYYLSAVFLEEVRALHRTMGTYIHQACILVSEVDNDTLKDISSAISNPAGERLIVIRVDQNFNIYTLVNSLLSIDFNELLVINGQISGL
jgi:hypothetical protein